jgi:hypothetical protein
MGGSVQRFGAIRKIRSREWFLANRERVIESAKRLCRRSATELDGGELLDEHIAIEELSADDPIRMQKEFMYDEVLLKITARGVRPPGIAA